MGSDNNTRDALRLSQPEFLPFVRHDRFGINGKTPQPLTTNILLYVGAVLLLPLRFVLIISTLCTFMGITWVVAKIFPREQQPAVLTPFGLSFSRALLFFLGFVNIKWVYVGKEGSLAEAAKCQDVGCIVSNHASWADILILCSMFFNTYVAKASITTLPLIGFLSQVMRVIFVNREVSSTLIPWRMLAQTRHAHSPCLLGLLSGLQQSRGSGGPCS